MPGPTWFKIYICVVPFDSFVRMERIVWLSFYKRKIKMSIGVYWQLILVFLVMVYWQDFVDESVSFQLSTH